MKKYFLVFLLICTNAESKIVTAKGFGSTESKALKQAKNTAIEMVAGSWMNAESKLTGEELSTNSQSFTTGVIESFDIIERGRERGEAFIVIKASVINRKDNSIKDNSLNVNPDQVSQLVSNQKHIFESFKSMDDVDKALSFKTKKIDYSVSNASSVILTITGKVTFQPKWETDYKELIKRYSDYKFRIIRCEQIFFKVYAILENKKEIKGFSESWMEPRPFRGGEFDFDFDMEAEIKAEFPNVDNVHSFRVNFYCF